MTTNTTTVDVSPRRGGKGLTIAIVVSALLGIAGIVLWGLQLSGGLVQTGMRDLNTWGLYITLFMFFVGLSAGGLIISSVPKALGLRGFGGIAKVAIWTSIVCTVLALIFIVIDMGHPFRAWELFVYSNFSSPLMWDVAVILTYLILSIVYLVATLSHEKGKVSDTAMRTISVLALAVAILVHSVTAWIFGLQIAHPFWHSALLGPWFVASALVSGTALVLIVISALNKTGYLSVEKDTISRLAKLLGIFVLVDLYFFACELLTLGYPGGQGLEIVSLMATGPIAPVFWLEIAFLAIAAIIMFVPKLRENPILIVGALFAVAGVFCKRLLLILTGFQHTNITYAGPVTGNSLTGFTEGFTGAYQTLIYTPTAFELAVVVGMLGAGVFLLLAGLKFLPLAPKDEA